MNIEDEREALRAALMEAEGRLRSTHPDNVGRLVEPLEELQRKLSVFTSYIGGEVTEPAHLLEALRNIIEAHKPRWIITSLRLLEKFPKHVDFSTNLSNTELRAGLGLFWKSPDPYRNGSLWWHRKIDHNGVVIYNHEQAHKVQQVPGGFVDDFDTPWGIKGKDNWVPSGLQTLQFKDYVNISRRDRFARVLGSDESV